MHFQINVLPRTIFIAFPVILFIACNSSSSEPERKDSITQIREKESEDMVSRGSYLVNAGGCNHCHSPKTMTPQGPVVDTTRILSGHPSQMPQARFDRDALKPGNWIQMGPDLTSFVGPWGISYAINLTPDTTTGIGAWSEDVFIKTLRTGKHMGQESGRPILPPMPWQEFAKMKDEDLKSIYAYLKSIPAINNRIPAPLSPADAAKFVK